MVFGTFATAELVSGSGKNAQNTNLPLCHVVYRESSDKVIKVWRIVHFVRQTNSGTTCSAKLAAGLCFIFVKYTSTVVSLSSSPATQKDLVKN